MGVRFGRYELVRLLGRGGMAEVFLARYVGPQGFEKRLVIKRILPEYGRDRRFLRLFFEEARTQVSLSHGNLVPVFDFGRVGNAYFIAMEEVRGCDLGTLLAAGHKRELKLSPMLVAHVGIEVCRGLAYVHRRGFVHRDVSPRNVLLSTEGEVKLSDFGVALTAASDAAPGLRGTLAYMAPEQARGERADGRADLYALGMVLAEAVSGRRVRVNADENAALAAARAGAPVAVDGPLAALLARATATDPAARFADAEAMGLALEEAAAALGRAGAAAARELAACVAEWVPQAASADGARADEPAVATAATVGEETYFRDRGSESFVDEVLDDDAGARAPLRRAWIAAAAFVVAAGGVLAATRAVQSAHRATAARAVATAHPTTAQPPAPRAATPQPPTPRPPAPQPAPPSPASHAAPTARHVAPPTIARKPTGTGTLFIHCTPWCIPSVDGEVRGSDGRNHSLQLTAGTHRVSARRLDDRVDRTVEIRAGESQTVDFTFD